MYTPITKQEQEVWGYKSDGKPEDVPVYSSMSTFKDINLSDAIEGEIRNVLGIEDKKS
jgi:hypothetical protein